MQMVLTRGMNVLNSTGDYKHIIFGFIYSDEYRLRFS